MPRQPMMPPPEAAPGGERRPATAGEALGGEPASPIEQAQRSGIMAAAGDALYGEEGLERAIGLLGAGGDVIDNAARGTAMLMHAIASGLRAAGKQVSEDALLDAGEEVLARMLGVAVESGLTDIQSPEQFQQALEVGGARALEVYQSIAEGGAPGPGAPPGPEGQPPTAPGPAAPAPGAAAPPPAAPGRRSLIGASMGGM